MVELKTNRSWIIGILIAVNSAYFLSKDKGKHATNKLGILGFDIPDVVCFSPSELAVPIEQLSFSTGVILFICALSHFLRQAVDQYVSDSLIRILLQEAIAAADLCGCCFELIVGEFSPPSILPDLIGIFSAWISFQRFHATN